MCPWIGQLSCGVVQGSVGRLMNFLNPNTPTADNLAGSDPSRGAFPAWAGAIAKPVWAESG